MRTRLDWYKYSASVSRYETTSNQERKTISWFVRLVCFLVLQAVGVSVIEDIDVSAEDSGEKLVAAVRERLGEGGSLDYVICNAGYAYHNLPLTNRFTVLLRLTQIKQICTLE